MQPLAESARAKINLTLRVRGRRGDGYHDLESIVAFADCADTLTLDMGSMLGLDVVGPMAAECGSLSDNLVLKAAQALALRVPGLKLGRFRLDKHLPVAAGIGGGSADAAAALRLLARANNLPLDDARLIDAARSTGADVLVCVVSLGCLMRGVGDDLSPLTLPRFPCVLVNPRKAVSTPDVFAALGLKPGQPGKTAPALSVAASVSLEMIRSGRNDLEGVACRIEPVIAEVLGALSVTQGVMLSRMSGSGATCFGLYENAALAQSAADAIGLVHPEWWVWSGELG
jgi:4-diphosphocytidyl-2-C-methyl-D-erythritol kinase